MWRCVWSYQRHPVSKSGQSLQGSASDTIISQLGKVAEGINSRFTCGGKVLLNKPIELAYHQGGAVKQWSSLEFPGVSEPDMIKLLDACSVASFGYKGKDVIDENYRNAFKLEPDNFLTNLQISATPILQEIQSFVSTIIGLKAELYKLNIYACGGFFKAHVDTPRSEKMFGSLVVCLPTQFTGGELIVRHHKQEIKYDWSSTAPDTSSTLHWAAFFSDIEHEVLPVSEGYRVTLTYNLSYQSKEAAGSALDVKTNSFYKLLQAALSNPVFMRDGGVLGFNSHYSYVFDTQWADLLTHINTIEDKADTIKQLQFPCDEFVHLSKDKQMKVLRDAGVKEVDHKKILDAIPSDLPLLKGVDYIVVESAKSLGLPVCVKPFLSNNRGDENFEYAFKDFSQCTSMFEEGCLGYLDDHQVEPLQLFGNTICRYKAQDITWCQELFYHQPAGAALHYGNNASVDLWYKSAAILIRIPKWSEYRQKLIAVSTGEYSSVNTADEMGDHDSEVMKDFGNIFQDSNEIVQKEIQELNDQFEELLGNPHVNEIEGLMDILKTMQTKLLKSQAHTACQLADMIYCFKSELEYLRCDIESEHRIGQYRLEKLRDACRGFW